MDDSHDYHYVTDDWIGEHHAYMRWSSFYAVSAFILSMVAKDIEDHQFWNARAVEARMIWC